MTTLQVEKIEERFSRMAAAAPVGMFVFDADGQPLHLNDAYIQMLGDNRESHLDRYSTPASLWEEYIHTDDNDRFRETWDSIRERKLPVTIEYRLKRPGNRSTKTLNMSLVARRGFLPTLFQRSIRMAEWLLCKVG